MGWDNLGREGPKVNTRRRNSLIFMVLLAAVMTAYAERAVAQDTPSTRWTLIGLTEAGIFIAPIDTIFGDYFAWSPEDLEFEATVKIREAGIWLIQPEFVRADAPPRFDGPFLRISAVPTPMPSGSGYSVTVRAEMVQPALLDRDVFDLCGRRSYRYCEDALRAGQRAPVTTWSAEAIRVMDLTDFVELPRTVSLLVDRFVTAWRAANEI